MAASARPKIHTVLGTMQFGVPKNDKISSPRITSPELTKTMLDFFVGKGFTELDTARMYGDHTTEEFLGQLGLENFIVATKAYPGYNSVGLTRENIRQQLKESLDALRVPSVDLFYLHWPDHQTPIEDSLKAVNELYHEKKFKRFGISNYSAQQVEKIMDLCGKNNWVKPSVYQGMYNMITRNIEDLFPVLRRHSIAFYAYNPLAGGLLTGKYSFEDQPNDGRFSVQTVWGQKYRDRYWKQSVFDQLAKVQSACQQHGISLASAAIQWMYWHSALVMNDAVILGASSINQLKDNLDAACAKESLPDSVVSAIEEAWTLARNDCPQYWR